MKGCCVPGIVWRQCAHTFVLTHFWQQSCGETRKARRGCCWSHQTPGLRQHRGLSWRGRVALPRRHVSCYPRVTADLVAVTSQCAGDIRGTKRGEASEGCLCTDEGPSSHLLGIYAVPQRRSPVQSHSQVSEEASARACFTLALKLQCFSVCACVSQVAWCLHSV